MAITVEKEERPHAEVLLKGVLPAKIIETEYESAIREAGKHVAVPGFRKGHVPRERVIKEAGESFLWRDAAERSLKGELDEILKKENIVPVVPLSLSFTKVEPKGHATF